MRLVSIVFVIGLHEWFGAFLSLWSWYVTYIMEILETTIYI